MNFKSFLFESLLLEGGNAVKISTPINQANAKSTIDKAVDVVLRYLGLENNDNNFAIVGSIGKKTDPSGDIDIIVNLKEIKAEDKLLFIEKQVEKLAKHIFDSNANSSQKFSDFYKPMKTIGVFSFAFPISNVDKKQQYQYIQVDVTPVENIEFSKWSNHSHEEDISKGLKGSQRNELLYAIAKYYNPKRTLDKNGNLVKLERHFYDRNKGLYKGVQSRQNKSGKLNSSFALEGSKSLISQDLNKITKLLFGEKYKPEDLLSFSQVYKALKDKSFPHQDEVENILKMAKSGIEKKKLKIPKELENI